MSDAVFLLVHSPLVGHETWASLVPILEQAGGICHVAKLDNRHKYGEPYYSHHLAQIAEALPGDPQTSIVAIAHSGGGNLLAALDEDRIKAYVLVDAIYPTGPASRFSLFDDESAVQAWRQLAATHGGMIPATALSPLAEQIENQQNKEQFLRSLTDVPIELYEENIPVSANWQANRRPGLYVRYSDGYLADMKRAVIANWQILEAPGMHMDVLNKPGALSESILAFITSGDISF